MSLTKSSVGFMFAGNIRRHTFLQAIRRLTSASTPPSQGGSDGNIGEKAKETMDNVAGVAKDASQKLKDRAMGTGGNNSKPSQNPELNHCVEPTNSSCEDVRGRPGGYS